MSADARVASAAPHEQSPAAPQPAGPAPAGAPRANGESLATAGPIAPGSPSATPASAPAEMLDIEARVEVLVGDSTASARALRAAVESASGSVTSEVLQTGSLGEGIARVTLRVPVARSQELLAVVARLGEVRLQQITARDVGKEFFDAGILLSNLQATLARYQAILERAQNVQEVLEVEAQLARVRGDIERIQGELRYLKDRSARATIHVELRTRPRSQVVTEEEPTALFYPGVRASILVDLRGADGNSGYSGAGISVRFTRALSIEIDGLRRLKDAAPGLDALLVTLGSDLYSAFASGGRRRFMNPYLGYRIGYARFPGGEDTLALGAVAGLEAVKTESLSVDLDVTGTGFVGDESPHFGVQPALSVNFAF